MPKVSTSYKPGQSGNPHGRPRRNWTWASVLQAAVQKKTKSGKTVKQLIAESLVAEAEKGNVQAHKAIMDRMDGLPKQDIDVTSDGKSLVVEHLYHGSDRKTTV